ncbi:hypothetical protein N0V91_003062 [Didymella pomorum]|uniref:Uncharacterized protein n=1 Tax=Didymella pomorum TaxID=749634 RepID=A0A9W8ZLB3_9PLEO|nr:hypothetical protein N0V91_003062 [Didymella pomorum]
MSNVPEDRVAKAEKVKTQIIEYMQKQIAEQLGVDVNHPYASGKFDIAHSDSDGFVEKPKVIERGKSNTDALDATYALLRTVDPARMEYRSKKW